MDFLNPRCYIALPIEHSDSYFDILMNRASHFERPQKSLPKFYL